MDWGHSELNRKGKFRETGGPNAVVEPGLADLGVTLDVTENWGFAERFGFAEEGELSF